MIFIFTPAVMLMRGLRLLPKFSLVTALFTFPLVLVASLFFNELDRELQQSEKARKGLGNITHIHDTTRSLMHLRGQHHLAGAARQQLSTTTIDLQSKLQSAFEQDRRLEKFRDAWSRTQLADTTHVDGEYMTLISSLLQQAGYIADQSGVTLDETIISHHLAYVSVHDLPALAANLSLLTSRGASYIETGLMEANDDLLLQSSHQIARHDLANLSRRIEVAIDEDHEVRNVLAPTMAGLEEIEIFLQRVEHEVLRTLDQTSGAAYLDAGLHSIDKAFDLAHQSAATVDTLLVKRIESIKARHKFMMLVMSTALLGAAYLLFGFYLAFKQDLGHLRNAVRRIAEGDLTSQIDTLSRDELGQLVRSFAQMNAGLSALVASARGGSSAVSDAASLIHSHSTNLSKDTNAQTRSLRKTAQNIDQFLLSVRCNRDDAVRAAELVAQASRVAAQGGDSVQDVMHKMERIQESSDRIVDIIRVIDSIAFQTNLLALNAAVEAARAGEHGRSFAIVAGEVRALARRSSHAAQEVKTLISYSVEQVNEGTVLAGCAEGTMKHIIQEVAEVRELMERIATTCNEQTMSVEQANQSVSDLNSTGQRNVASVEHVAGAIQVLQIESTKLAQSVAVFRLDHGYEAQVL